MERQITFTHNEVHFFTYDLKPYTQGEKVMFSSHQDINLKIRLRTSELLSSNIVWSFNGVEKNTDDDDPYHWGLSMNLREIENLSSCEVKVTISNVKSKRFQKKLTFLKF